MHRLPVGQKNHAQKTTLHLWNPDPSSDASVRLDVLANRGLDGSLDPLFSNQGPIGRLRIASK
jgi:hypothetical protein